MAAWLSCNLIPSGGQVVTRHTGHAGHVVTSSVTLTASVRSHTRGTRHSRQLSFSLHGGRGGGLLFFVNLRSLSSGTREETEMESFTLIRALPLSSVSWLVTVMHSRVTAWHRPGAVTWLWCTNCSSSSRWRATWHVTRDAWRRNCGAGCHPSSWCRQQTLSLILCPCTTLHFLRSRESLIPCPGSRRLDRDGGVAWRQPSRTFISHLFVSQFQGNQNTYFTHQKGWDKWWDIYYTLERRRKWRCRWRWRLNSPEIYYVAVMSKSLLDLKGPNIILIYLGKQCWMRIV